MRKVFTVLTVALFISACSYLDKRIAVSDQANHPSMVKFLRYEKAVTKTETFDSIYKDYFALSDWKKIEESMGWARLVYSSSFKALKNGRCDALRLKLISYSKAVVFCEGYYLRNGEYSMKLKVHMHRVGENCYIGRSGLKHETLRGNEVGFGLKF